MLRLFLLFGLVAARFKRNGTAVNNDKCNEAIWVNGSVPNVFCDECTVSIKHPEFDFLDCDDYCTRQQAGELVCVEAFLATNVINGSCLPNGSINITCATPLNSTTVTDLAVNTICHCAPVLCVRVTALPPTNVSTPLSLRVDDVVVAENFTTDVAQEFCFVDVDNITVQSNTSGLGQWFGSIESAPQNLTNVTAYSPMVCPLCAGTSDRTDFLVVSSFTARGLLSTPHCLAGKKCELTPFVPLPLPNDFCVRIVTSRGSPADFVLKADDVVQQLTPVSRSRNTAQVCLVRPTNLTVVPLGDWAGGLTSSADNGKNFFAMECVGCQGAATTTTFQISRTRPSAPSGAVCFDRECKLSQPATVANNPAFQSRACSNPSFGNAKFGQTLVCRNPTARDPDVDLFGHDFPVIRSQPGEREREVKNIPKGQVVSPVVDISLVDIDDNEIPLANLTKGQEVAVTMPLAASLNFSSLFLRECVDRTVACTLIQNATNKLVFSSAGCETTPIEEGPEAGTVRCVCSQGGRLAVIIAGQDTANFCSIPTLSPGHIVIGGVYMGCSIAAACQVYRIVRFARRDAMGRTKLLLIHAGIMLLCFTRALGLLMRNVYRKSIVSSVALFALPFSLEVCMLAELAWSFTAVNFSMNPGYLRAFKPGLITAVFLVASPGVALPFLIAYLHGSVQIRVGVAATYILSFVVIVMCVTILISGCMLAQTMAKTSRALKKVKKGKEDEPKQTCDVLTVITIAISGTLLLQSVCWILSIQQPLLRESSLGAALGIELMFFGLGVVTQVGLLVLRLASVTKCVAIKQSRNIRDKMDKFSKKDDSTQAPEAPLNQSWLHGEQISGVANQRGMGLQMDRIVRKSDEYTSSSISLPTRTESDLARGDSTGSTGQDPVRGGRTGPTMKGKSRVAGLLANFQGAGGTAGSPPTSPRPASRPPSTGSPRTPANRVGSRFFHGAMDETGALAV